MRMNLARSLSFPNSISLGRSTKRQFGYWNRNERLRVFEKHRPRQDSSAIPLAGEIADLANSLPLTLVDLVGQAPEPIRQMLELLLNDAQDLFSMAPTSSGIIRLSLVYFLLFSRPSPAACFLDFFILRPVGMLFERRWSSADFSIRERMGTGNFGTAFEAVIKKPDEEENLRGQLTPEQKERRVVLKRVNLDQEGIRSNFLKFGTVAKGAAEQGQVESYMYGRVKRNLFVSPYCADFKGLFFADETIGSITAGSQWLVWNFETDSTLAAAIEGRLGQFPDSVSDLFLPNANTLSEEERAFKTVQCIFREITTGVQRLHSIGIVHRDVKPDNLLLTVKGEVKIIDFGAAADMSTGINFNPLVGILDPRYSPPEEYIVPQNFPRAPFPWLAVFLAPFIWQLGRPDLFDSYSLGMILMQMSIPQLRTPTNQTSFANDLKTYFNDLNRWRQESARARNYDFSLLDMRNEAGWDLARQLVCRRNDFLRGRLSTDDALNHRYFK